MEVYVSFPNGISVQFAGRFSMMANFEADLESSNMYLGPALRSNYGTILLKLHSHLASARSTCSRHSLSDGLGHGLQRGQLGRQLGPDLRPDDVPDHVHEGAVEVVVGLLGGGGALSCPLPLGPCPFL